MARLTGRFGTLAVAGDQVADLNDWTIEYTVEAVPCPIKGERANTVSVGGLDIRITASRFFDDAVAGNADSLSKRAVDQFQTAVEAVLPGTIVAYVLEQINGIAGHNARISGNAVVVRGSLNAPRDLTQDTFEMVGVDVPTIDNSN